MKNRLLRLTLLIVPLAMGACALTPGPDDPVTIKLNDLDNRIGRLEQGVQNQASLVGQVQSLEGEVRELRGQIEELQYKLDGVSERQRNLYVDVDGRLQALESGGSAAPGSTSNSTRPTTPPRTGGTVVTPSASGGTDRSSAGTTDRDDYQAAIALLRDGHYQEAAQAFDTFLKQHTGSQYSDNAQYWYGEAFYVTRKFNEALAAFQKVVSDYPQSQKVPDALLKIGYCDYELGYWDAARAALTRVTTDFSDTAASRLARLRLEQMTSEGH